MNGQSITTPQKEERVAPPRLPSMASATSRVEPEALHAELSRRMRAKRRQIEGGGSSSDEVSTVPLYLNLPPPLPPDSRCHLKLHKGWLPPHHHLNISIPTNPNRMYTPMPMGGGITVQIITGDALQEQGEVLVNPANAHDLNHGGGLARAICDNAGDGFQAAGFDYVA